MADGAFPFLFHGPSPDDWFDEPVHAWLLRFERVVNAAERASLAPLWERGVRDHARGLGADFNLPWVWNGEWALVHVRPGDRSRDTMRALFAAMQSMLRAVREVAPLAEVIYAQAADVSSDSAWEAWTVTQSPVATEAPPWPPEVVTHAKKSRKRSKAALDPTFEAARAQARAGVAVAKVASVAEEEDDEEVEASEPDEDDPEALDEASDENTSDEDSSDDDGEVTLPEPRGFPLRLVKLDDDEAERLNVENDNPSNKKYDQFQHLPDGTWVAVPKRGKRDKSTSLVMVVDGESVATPLSGDELYSVRAWCPDRREFFKVSPDYRELLAVAIDGGAKRTAWTDVARDSLNEVFALRDDVLLITHSRGVTALAPKAPGDATAYHHAWGANSSVRAPDRRGVVSCNEDAATVVRVTGLADGALRVAGEVCVKSEGYAYLEKRGEVAYLMADNNTYRVEGIGEALDALFAAPTDRERFPALPEILAPEVLADPTRNADVDDCYNRAAGAKDEDDNAAAERWYRRVVELNPTHAMGLHGLGHILQRLGREAEATPLLERALAAYATEMAAQEDDDEREELRFWHTAVLSRLKRRDAVIAELRAMIPEGYRSNYLRQRIANEEDFEWLKTDEEFKALTAKVAKPKRAAKPAKKVTVKKGAAKKAGDDDDEGDGEE